MRAAERPWRVGVGVASAGVVSFGVAAGAMVATPLLPRGGAARRVLASATVAGLAVTTATRARRVWGTPRALGALVAVTSATLGVERLGSTRGVPFGRYSYTGALRPEVAGVPALVPLAWWAMALPAREAVAGALGPRATPWTRIAAGAVALTAWDLFLDPQMVGEGYWTWKRPGRYRGIPASNYAGWLVSSAALMAMLEVVLPARARADAALVGEYAFMGVMETVGFAAFFRDRVVASTGGAAMLPVAAAAILRRARPTSAVRS